MMRRAAQKKPGMMQVAMYYSNDDIRLQKMLTPTIGRKEVLMRIEASGICGSDAMEWYRADKVPLVLGHEVSGVLVGVGGGVKKFRLGDRVVVTHHVPCGRCEYCQNGHPTVCETLRKTSFYPGGFSQFIRVPAINIARGMLSLPKGMTFEEGTFVEPLGCALRGQRLAGMKKGKRVLVIGSGLSGLLHIKLARFFGAKKIIATDVDPYRLKAARKFGATTIRAGDDVPAKVKKICSGRLADLVIICSAAQSAVESALRSVERGATVLFFSAAQKDEVLPVSTNDIFWRSEVTLLSSYAASPADLKDALQLIAKKKIVVRDMITHRLKLKNIQKGFRLVAKPKHSMKVIIEPQE